MSILPADLSERFEREGFYAPLPAVTPARAAAVAADLARLEREHGPEVWTRTKLKPHLLVKSINELAREPAILDAVEQALGPDLLVWGVGIFSKPARDPGFYGWHQDATYWGLSEPALATAWVALTPSTRDNGCMRVVPGTHHTAVPHKEEPGNGSLLSRGQEVAVEVDERDAVDLVLEPGQMSIHHVMLVHGSEPNRSDGPRIGIGIRYIAARVAPLEGFEDSATLVRGVDRHQHWIPEPKPASDFDPVCTELYDRIVAQSRARAEAAAARQS